MKRYLVYDTPEACVIVFDTCDVVAMSHNHMTTTSVAEDIIVDAFNFGGVMS